MREALAMRLDLKENRVAVSQINDCLSVCKSMSFESDLV